MTPSVLLSWQQFCFRIILCSIDIRNPTLFTSNELVKRRRAIWTLRAFQVGQKWRYLVHNRERGWGRKSYHGNVIMAINGCYFVSYMAYIIGAKFEQYHYKMSRDILDFVIHLRAETICDVINF